MAREIVILDFKKKIIPKKLFFIVLNTLFKCNVGFILRPRSESKRVIQAENGMIFLFLCYNYETQKLIKVNIFFPLFLYK